VIDHVDPIHQPFNQFWVDDVTHDHFQLGMTGRVCQALHVKVDGAHPVPLGQLAVDQVAADEAATARNQNLHFYEPSAAGRPGKGNREPDDNDGVMLASTVVA
jgi:hypothetical protein